MTTMQRTIQAREAGFVRDVITVAGRALRSIPRDPESVIPALIFPAFFFIVNIGALQDVAERQPGLDFKAFQIPVAIVFAVTGISRAVTLVTDIQSGYFDRLGLTPVTRLALLLGLMVADLTMVVALTIPVLILGFALGVEFATGVPGVAVIVLFAGLWGLVFTGFPYAIALKTGNPAAVNMSFIVFMPVLFLTPMFMPLEAMTDWMAAIARYNPVTYVLGAMRSLISTGWEADVLLKGAASVAGVGVLSMSLALMALRGRVTRR